MVKLDTMCEDALSAILKEYDGNPGLAVSGGSGVFPKYMRLAHNEVFTKLKNTGILASFKMVLRGWNAYLTPDALTYFEQKEKEKMSNFEKLPSNSRALLQEIVEADNAVALLQDRFKQCADNKGDDYLRGLIRELIDKQYIEVTWADDVPWFVQVNNSARTYSEREAEHEATIAVKRDDANIKTKQFDLFLSHANKDKLVYVDELYSSLSKLGIEIFYDKNSLSWGDNWKQRILNGVESSEFAIIVVSKNYFGREWTERELNEFLQRQNSTSQKIILPILYEISHTDLQEHYPELSDIQCLAASDHSADEVGLLFANELIKRMRNI